MWANELDLWIAKTFYSRGLGPTRDYYYFRRGDVPEPKPIPEPEPKPEPKPGSFSFPFGKQMDSIGIQKLPWLATDPDSALFSSCGSGVRFTMKRR